MGSVVTVMNMKGGVGKTTVTMHLGGIFARRGIGGRTRKVLLIDYDPQFNLTQAFLKPKIYFDLEGQRKTCLAILQDDEAALDPFKLQTPANDEPPSVDDVVYNVYQRLDIVPSTMKLMYVALGQADKRTKVYEKRFRAFIDGCRQKYDLVMIDCHPAGSILTKTSLQNSDHVLIPVMPQQYAVRGVDLMKPFVEGTGRKAAKSHILFNRTPRSGISADEAEIRANPRFTEKCLSRKLTKFKVFSEPMAGQGFVWTSSRPYSTQAFHNLCAVAEEFAARTGV